MQLLVSVRTSYDPALDGAHTLLCGPFFDGMLFSHPGWRGASTDPTRCRVGPATTIVESNMHVFLPMVEPRCGNGSFRRMIGRMIGQKDDVLGLAGRVE